MMDYAFTIIYQEWVAYTVSIMEFHDGKVVHDTKYFADPFMAPAWRLLWVHQMGNVVLNG